MMRELSSKQISNRRKCYLRGLEDVLFKLWNLARIFLDEISFAHATNWDGRINLKIHCRAGGSAQVQTTRSLASSFIPPLFCLDPRTYIGKAQIIKDHSCCLSPYLTPLHAPAQAVPWPQPQLYPYPQGTVSLYWACHPSQRHPSWDLAAMGRLLVVVKYQSGLGLLAAARPGRVGP